MGIPTILIIFLFSLIKAKDRWKMQSIIYKSAKI